MNKELHPVRINDFSYSLPPERIAHFPLPFRHNSKLLVYKDRKISEDIFYNLDNFIPENTLMIFNNSKVVKARMLFVNESGNKIEIFCLEPTGNLKEIESAFSKKGECEWLCLIGNLKKWKSHFLFKEVRGKRVKAELLEKSGEDFKIRFTWEPEEMTFGEMLSEFGKIPLPPYMNREALTEDEKNYQTVYAKYEGSVAAPTAGLHFTEEVLNKLEEQNIKREFLTLHVGAGTFLPVKGNDILSHKMHSEIIKIRKSFLKNILKDKTNIISVGTTSLRALESIYWLGVKLKENISKDFKLMQWEAYDLLNKSEITLQESFGEVLNYMEKKNLETLPAETEIIIVPGYKFKTANTLITNFHQPKSTLLLLIAAFIGEEWKSVYNYALKNDFRFLSYGDSSILFR